MTTPADPVSPRLRYIAGLCIDCGLHNHSPGRPRCENCHKLHQNPYQIGVKSCRTSV